MALSGPAHYAKADELLAEIEATPALSSETETSLANRAVARGPCCGSRHRSELIGTRYPGMAGDGQNDVQGFAAT